MTNDYVTGLHEKIKSLKKEISYLNRSNAKKSDRIRQLEQELNECIKKLNKLHSKSELVKMLAESFLSDIKRKKK